MSNQLLWDLKPDQTYTLVRVLGQGVYGEVSLAVRRADAQAYYRQEKVPLFAVKVYKQISLDNMNREVRILLESKNDAVCHPNVVCYADHYIGVPSNTYNLVSYYVSGTRMQELKESPPPEKLRPIIHSLLEGLMYLHSKNIVHRDIKGDNVLIMNYETTNPTAVYLDLGLGCQGEADCLAQPLSIEQYKSPEQLEGRNLTLPEFKSSDVWFLAQAIVYMITRKNIISTGKLESLGSAIQLLKKRRNLGLTDPERAKLELNITQKNFEFKQELKEIHKKLVVTGLDGRVYPTQLLASIKDEVSRNILIEMFQLKWKRRLLPLTGVMLLEREDFKLKKAQIT